jgi:hypothetical protein
MCLVHYDIVGRTMMGEKRTMTLNLSEEEMNSLDQLALRNDMSKTAVVGKAIRIYLILAKRMQRVSRVMIFPTLGSAGSLQSIEGTLSCKGFAAISCIPSVLSLHILLTAQ